MSFDRLGLLSFGFAAAVFAVLAIVLAVRGTNRAAGRTMLTAAVVQAAWAVVMALSLGAERLPAIVIDITESLRTMALTIFILALPETRSDGNSDPNARRFFDARSLGITLAIGVAAASTAAAAAGAGLQIVVGLRLCAVALGLVVLEQVHRNAAIDRRSALKLISISLLALFGFDLLMYSEALLYSQMNRAWWTARGFANAMVVPLLAIGALRLRDWKLEIAISRKLAFHSIALVAIGIYLLLIAAGGYYVRFLGGSWGGVAQAVLVFAAAVGLMLVGFSGALRARIQVLVSKHLFNYRYDYRDEWLRLTRLLSDSSSPDEAPDALALRALQGLCALVQSTGGAIWLRDRDEFVYLAGVGHDLADQSVNPSESTLRYLFEREWIVDLHEYAQRPDLYPGLQIPESFLRPKYWLLVPMMLRDQPVGLALLHSARTPVSVNWEVRDILKTAARQIASYIGVQRATEELFRARQFESFNRMSAFVVHDLKNLIAQLALMTKNAHRHRGNPQFESDMIDTVENVLERLRALTSQLRVGARSAERAVPVVIAAVLEKSVRAKRHLNPAPKLTLEFDRTGVAVLAHADRLERVVGHLIQNACEACRPDGKVDVFARLRDAILEIEVRDDGSGMSREFIRNRLFRPFSSQKAHGMGIGTFESREYIREIGGSLELESKPGAGTVFRIKLPFVVSATRGFEREIHG